MPLFQTLAWIVFVFVLLFVIRVKGETLWGLIFERLRSGAAISAGPFSIGSPPKEILKGEAAGVTSEGTQGSPTPALIEQSLTAGKYPPNVVDDMFIVHEAQIVRERTDERVGLFRVRITLETWKPEDMEQIASVTYKLHPSFRRQIITTAAKEKSFELWLNVIGEFCIVAVVTRKGKEPIWLSRYVNLPGRPPD